MSGKGGGFWDNPFGGLFDLNGDGKEDLGEQLFAFEMSEKISKDKAEQDDSWRLYCREYILAMSDEEKKTLDKRKKKRTIVCAICAFIAVLAVLISVSPTAKFGGFANISLVFSAFMRLTCLSSRYPRSRVY